MVAGMFTVPFCNIIVFRYRRAILGIMYFLYFMLLYARAGNNLGGHLATPGSRFSWNIPQSQHDRPWLLFVATVFISTLTAGPPQTSRLSMQLRRCKRQVSRSQFHMHPRHVLASCLP